MDQEPINVYWVSYHDDILARGYWDNGLLEDTFKRVDCIHHEVKNKQFTKVKEGGVFIINGRTHIEDTDKINADINKLPWVLFIVTGDEEASFPWREIKHPIMRVWVMLPRMTEHNDTHFKLPNGYRPTTKELLKEIGQQERDLDWSFVGQVNHERRQQCFDVLEQFRSLYPKAYLHGTDGFGKEDVAYPEYLKIMARSKIVLCPSGIESPDNFRLYEALEAGCLPVVDAFSTNFKTPGFWRYLFGGDVPFPIVDYWDAFPDMIPGLLADYPANANRCFAWWQGYKRKLKWQLIDDVTELSR